MGKAADDFLNVGDSYPPITLKAEGDSFKGVIVKIPAETITVKPKNGDPEYDSLPITIDTEGLGNEDDYKTLWVHKFGIKKAIKEACEKVGPSTRIAVGGTLAIKVTGFEDVKKPSPMTLYAAAYKPPVAAASDAVDEFFDV